MEMEKNYIQLMKNKKIKTDFKAKEMHLHIIYDELFAKMTDLTFRYKDAQMVASTMVAQSLRLYRTILNEKQFNEVIATVLRNLKDVRPYEPPRTQ